ncbi:MAG: TetR/AcrR family transcriptional regulator [Lachnospiraceae bacterium]
MKEDQRIRLSKQLLQNALISLLKEKSINKISVREICDTAQINRTTFYKYYGSQYDLLAAIETHVLDTLSEGMNDNNPSERLLPKLLKQIDENIELYRLLLNNNIDPLFPQKLLNLPAIKEQLSNIVEDKSFAKYGEYTYEFLVWGGYSVIVKWLNKEKRESPEELAEFINKVFMRIGIEA